DFHHANKPSEERNGFVFNDYNQAGLESALRRAIGLWFDYPDSFQQLMANGMRYDYSWANPAKHYTNIYNHIRDPAPLPQPTAVPADSAVQAGMHLSLTAAEAERARTPEPSHESLPTQAAAHPPT